MTKIILANTSEITATGHRTNGNCKPVICIDTGEVFASLTDAAEYLGVNPATLSYAANHTDNSKCKGKRWCYIKDIIQHLSQLTESIRAREAKANAYDDIVGRAEALHKAEENLAKQKANREKLLRQLKSTDLAINEAEINLHMLQSTQPIFA